MLGDLVKSGVWAVLQMAIGFAVSFAVTGSAGFAVCIALLLGSIGSFTYFFFERACRIWAQPRR